MSTSVNCSENPHAMLEKVTPLLEVTSSEHRIRCKLSDNATIIPVLPRQGDGYTWMAPKELALEARDILGMAVPKSRSR